MNTEVVLWFHLWKEGEELAGRIQQRCNSCDGTGGAGDWEVVRAGVHKGVCQYLFTQCRQLLHASALKSSVLEVRDTNTCIYKMPACRQV